jgi:hypothetical protein
MDLIFSKSDSISKPYTTQKDMFDFMGTETIDPTSRYSFSASLR